MKKNIKMCLAAIFAATIGTVMYLIGYSFGNEEGFEEGKLSMMGYKDYFDEVTKKKKVSRSDVSGKKED